MHTSDTCLTYEPFSLTSRAADERLPAQPSTELREEIFHFAADASEVRHARTARVRGAIAHLFGRLAALVARSVLPVQPLPPFCGSLTPSRQALRTQAGALASWSSTTSSPKGRGLPSPRQRAAMRPSARSLPRLGARHGADPSDGAPTARRRPLLRESLAPHHPPGGYNHQLFELRTLVCGSCAVAADAALAGDRRAFRIDRPCLSRAAPWALKRRLSAPTLAHRCSMVAPMRLASAAGQWAGASGRQQQQQRAARRSGVRAAAISSSRGQPRSSCRRPSGGEAAAHALPARHRVPWGRGRGRQLVWGARGIDLVARPARSAHAS